MTPEQLEEGKMYFIQYGENTCVLVRFKKADSTRLYYFSHLHYWNGFETFHNGGESVKFGITNIRKASKPEKHSLFGKEIEHGTI